MLQRFKGLECFYVETVSVEKVRHEGTLNVMVSNITQHTITKEFILWHG